MLQVPDAKRKKTEPQEAQPVKKQGKQMKLTATKGSGVEAAGASKDGAESEGKAKTDLSKIDFKLESTTTKDGRCVHCMGSRRMLNRELEMSLVDTQVHW